MVNVVNAQRGSHPQLIILITSVQLKDNVVVNQEDGARSPTVVEDNPLEEALDIANFAEEQGQVKFTRVLHQNVRMSQEVGLSVIFSMPLGCETWGSSGELKRAQSWFLHKMLR